MQLTKISDQILHITCATRKELTLNFCRIQEFYESSYNHIRGRYFSLYDFIKAYADDNGELTYFKDWSGFNFPGKVYYQWHALNDRYLTEGERYIDSMIRSAMGPGTPEFYLIATTKGCDPDTINHEIAHAMFTLDSGYRIVASGAVMAIKPKLFNNLSAKLKKMGYGENVVVDEIQAYLSTTEVDELDSIFPLTLKEFRELLPTITLLQQNFKLAKRTIKGNKNAGTKNKRRSRRVQKASR